MDCLSKCNNGVLAVIVTYYPTSAQLQETLRTLLPQVAGAALIDNTPGGLPTEIANVIAQLREQYTHFFMLMENKENLGVGRAQNIGIRVARQHGFRYVLLSDQDSTFPSQTVRCLCEACQLLQDGGAKVAAIGAGHIPPGSSDLPVFVEEHWEKRIRVEKGVIPVAHVIASGCLIPVSVFDNVGYKDESLFIDWVDIEWCLRAKKSGFKVYGSGDAVITHRLGDGTVRFLGRRFTLHNHVRHYYIIRNAIIVAFYSGLMTTAQKIATVEKIILLLLVAPVVSRPRLRHLKMVSLGLLHGLLNKRGKLEIN